MYAALWRRLPGPAPVRALWCLLILVAVVAACFTWVFPWVAARLPVNDPSVRSAPSTTAATPVGAVR